MTVELPVTGSRKLGRLAGRQSQKLWVFEGGIFQPKHHFVSRKTACQSVPSAILISTPLSGRRSQASVQQPLSGRHLPFLRSVTTDCWSQISQTFQYWKLISQVVRSLLCRSHPPAQKSATLLRYSITDYWRYFHIVYSQDFYTLYTLGCKRYN